MSERADAPAHEWRRGFVSNHGRSGAEQTRRWRVGNTPGDERGSAEGAGSHQCRDGQRLASKSCSSLERVTTLERHLMKDCWAPKRKKGDGKGRNGEGKAKGGKGQRRLRRSNINSDRTELHRCLVTVEEGAGPSATNDWARWGSTSESESGGSLGGLAVRTWYREQRCENEYSDVRKGFGRRWQSSAGLHRQTSGRHGKQEFSDQESSRTDLREDDGGTGAEALASCSLIGLWA